LLLSTSSIVRIGDTTSRKLLYEDWNTEDSFRMSLAGMEGEMSLSFSDEPTLITTCNKGINVFTNEKIVLWRCGTYALLDPGDVLESEVLRRALIRSCLEVQPGAPKAATNLVCEVALDFSVSLVTQVPRVGKVNRFAGIPVKRELDDTLSLPASIHWEASSQEVAGTLPKKRRRERKRKDPRRPKGFVSAYNFFARATRSEVMRDLGPDPPKPNEVNRLIGQRWKTASVEEKARYVEQARLDKIRFSEVRWCIRTDTISVSRYFWSLCEGVCTLSAKRGFSQICSQCWNPCSARGIKANDRLQLVCQSEQRIFARLSHGYREEENECNSKCLLEIAERTGSCVLLRDSTTILE